MGTPELTAANGVWTDCWQCGGEGYLEGTCTCWDDTCCCSEPDEKRCDICKGKGGFFVTPEHADDADPMTHPNSPGQ